MPLTEAVWPKFAMQVFGSIVNFGKMRGGSRGFDLVPQTSHWATRFTCSGSSLARCTM